tara:strand:+ start:2277 stop:2543 length:267 start_codon:yes stop_codon:yes gene_type:complete
MKSFKNFKEGMDRDAIAIFAKEDDEEGGDITIYKLPNVPYYNHGYGDKGWVGDVRSDYDFFAKSMAELKQKIKRAGGNPNKPIYGKLK